MALPGAKAARRSRNCFSTVVVAVLACYLLADLQAADLLDGESLSAFAVPGASSPSTSLKIALGHDVATSDSPRWGMPRNPSSPKEPRTARSAAAAINFADMYVRCMNAMGAGAVASVIQAALSAVGEPIINRVLVKRMKVMEAVRDVSIGQMLNFFKTTLTTNFLKFPFFEVITAICFCLPIPPAVRGIVTGFVFTTLTLPVTNFRYRKSMELPVEWGNIYEAYAPTVIRDMVYGIARNYLTTFCIGIYPTLNSGSPSLLFPVVIGACLISAPFNEWRGYLLQSKGKKLSFEEFFKPSNFVRSTSLGAIKQGVALALGYWCAPPVRAFVTSLLASFK
eukprot:TRINITY_DN161_c0_g1_i3.p1 TRINITY_DN161_c0_g1~~TRINITY_DN161_c0_g1_i3.p1  ORF type:complete len:338 (+),score=73.65 TRINITY_DN161_c0_g1_i3:97-1110(+)